MSNKEDCILLDSYSDDDVDADAVSSSNNTIAAATANSKRITATASVDRGGGGNPIVIADSDDDDVDDDGDNDGDGGATEEAKLHVDVSKTNAKAVLKLQAAQELAQSEVGDEIPDEGGAGSRPDSTAPKSKGSTVQIPIEESSGGRGAAKSGGNPNKVVIVPESDSDSGSSSDESDEQQTLQQNPSKSMPHHPEGAVSRPGVYQKDASSPSQYSMSPSGRYECPHCDDDFSQERDATQHISRTCPVLFPGKRKRGRPPGSKNKSTLAAEAARPGTVLEYKLEVKARVGEGEKRKRGRPPGAKNKSTLAAETKKGQPSPGFKHMYPRAADGRYKCLHCDTDFASSSGVSRHTEKSCPTLFPVKAKRTPGNRVRSSGQRRMIITDADDSDHQIICESMAIAMKTLSTTSYKQIYKCIREGVALRNQWYIAYADDIYGDNGSRKSRFAKTADGKYECPHCKGGFACEENVGTHIREKRCPGEKPPAKKRKRRGSTASDAGGSGGGGGGARASSTHDDAAIVAALAVGDGHAALQLGFTDESSSSVAKRKPRRSLGSGAGMLNSSV